MNKKLLVFTTLLLSSCSLAPDFTLPDAGVPKAYKEQAADAQFDEQKGNWQPAVPLEKEDRGAWWKIFGDTQLNDLEKQAGENNQSLKAAAARVEQARGAVRANASSILPDLDIGANALRSKPPSAYLATFGQPAQQLKPYTLYNAQGTLSYEADVFGRVRENENAFQFDADAEAATYRSVLLALQADVAQNYFTLREMDAERQLLRDTVKIRQEAARIMQRRYDQGDVGGPDYNRAQSELAATEAELIALDRSRAMMDHALAVLLGKMPSEFTLAEAKFEGKPPAIPPGLPSTLLQRRPDIGAAVASMQSANARVGVARAAFFPILQLTASGGFESVALGDLFKWGSRTWALGQLAGNALTMPIFDSGRNQGRLDTAHAAYDEAVANYRNQLLVAFRDVEDNLTGQRLLSDQSLKTDAASTAASRTTELTRMRYDAGDVDYFEVVNAQRDSLAAERGALQIRGQRFITTVTLIRALGGGWEEPNNNSNAPPPQPLIQ